MRKQKITLIIVLVVLLALIGVLFALTKYNEKKEAEEEAEEEASTIQVFSIESDDVYSFSLTDSSDSPISFTYTDETWVLDSDTTAEVDQDVVADILSDLCDVTATDVITDGNASDYGVDTPSYTFTVSDSSGNTTTISYGIQNSITDEYYFVINGDTSTIYVNDGALISTCDSSMSSIIVTSDEEESETEDSTESEESEETSDSTEETSTETTEGN